MPVFAIDAEIAQIVERLVSADNPTLASACESQIVERQDKKVPLNEGRVKTGRSQNAFEAVFPNCPSLPDIPWKIGSLEDSTQNSSGWTSVHEAFETLTE